MKAIYLLALLQLLCSLDIGEALIPHVTPVRSRRTLRKDEGSCRSTQIIRADVKLFSIPNESVVPTESRPLRYSSNDWWHSLASLGRSRILMRISSHLIFTTAWTTLLAVVYSQFSSSIFVSRFLIILNPLPWTLLVGVLSLLLVFRTNSAYDRFWEARKLLGSMLIVCRNLALLGYQSCPTWTPADRSRFHSILAIFPKLLLKHLYYQDPKETLSQSELNEQDQRDVLTATNKPIRCLQILNSIYWPHSDRVDVMSMAIGDLVTVVGACERIVKCPVPRVYSRHTSRFLSLFCFTLPLVLLPSMGFTVIPTLAVISWALFSIEEIGHTIENPFDPTWVQELLNANSIVDALVISMREILFFGYEKEGQSQSQVQSNVEGQGEGEGGGEGGGSRNNEDDRRVKMGRIPSPLLL